MAENLQAALGDSPNFTQIGRACKIGKNTVDRAYNGSHAATTDTIEALADYIVVDPWILLMKGGVRSVGKVFGTAADDAKLGDKWTRPDREPLLQSDSAKPSTKTSKIKSR